MVLAHVCVVLACRKETVPRYLKNSYRGVSIHSDTHVSIALCAFHLAYHIMDPHLEECNAISFGDHTARHTAL